MNLTVTNVTIVTMDPSRRILKSGAVHVEDGRINDIGHTEEVRTRNPRTDTLIDGRGMVLIPGLFNVHTHSFQTLVRGVACDLELNEWLRKLIYPLSGKISASDIGVSAELSAIEALKSGTTFLLDHLTINTSPEALDRVAETFLKVGVRGVIARGITHRTRRADLWNIPKGRFPYSLEEEVKLTRDAVYRWNKLDGGKIKVWPAPVAIFSAGPDALKATWKICLEEKVGFHTHIAETMTAVNSTTEDYSCRDIEFLDRMGVLNHRTVLAHCVWLTEAEIELLARRNASVVHCPLSNMYLGSGVANVPVMLQKGVNVALGSDGGAVGSSHDMFGVIKTAALLHKVHNLRASILTATQVFEMATLAGAKAVGMEKELGSIEIGKRADLVLLNLSKTYTIPLRDIVTNIVYYATHDNVDTVMVDGNIVVQNGEVLTVDEERCFKDAQAASEDLISRAGIE